MVSIDNKKTNALNVSQAPTPESLKAQLDVAQSELNKKRGIQPTVSANELANPSPKLNLTTPPAPTIPDRVNTTINNTLGSIRSQSETAKRLQEEQAAFQTFTDGQSGFDIQNEQLQRFGVTPDVLQELKDIELQMGEMGALSRGREKAIAGGKGQTLAQGAREIAQENAELENAIYMSGLAARANVLQGNINTGRQLANDAVNIALQDRTFQANAKLQQISQLKEVVDEEQRQLLVAEERKYEAELSTIKELKENVSQAIVSGASQSEIATMNDPNTPDADKLALAQSVVARNAQQDIALDRQAKQANIANIYDQINSRAVAAREAVLTAGSEQEKVQLQKVAGSEKALEIKKLASDLKETAGLSSAVGFGFKKSLVGSIPFVSGDAVAGTNRANFEASAERLSNLLTLDNLKLMTGVLTDRDIQLLATAGSNLSNLNMSEQAYKAEIDRIIGTMDRTINNNGITQEQAVFWGGLTNDDVTTLDSLWDNL
jgi:hypothetical protein